MNKAEALAAEKEIKAVLFDLTPEQQAEVRAAKDRFVACTKDNPIAFLALSWAMVEVWLKELSE